MDLTTLLIIGLIIVVVVLLISRNRGLGGGSPIYRNRAGGAERPTYDDPGYTSSGSFGGNGADTPAQERSVGGAGGSRPTHDDPNYRSGGSIG